MTLRHRTTHRPSLALRLAVAGLAALLLPLATSRAQKATTGTDNRYRIPFIQARLVEIEDKLHNDQGDLEIARRQLGRAKELADAHVDDRARLQREQMEDRIREVFQKDPEVQPLIEQINDVDEALERQRELARRADDPAIALALRQSRRLKDQWQRLWETKHDTIKQRLQASNEDLRPEAWQEKVVRLETSIQNLEREQDDLRDMLVAAEPQKKGEAAKPKDDDDDQPSKDAEKREAGERLEKEVKELSEKLGNDLSPLGEVIRKALSRSLDEIQQALKKEGMTAEDLREALEKSRDELSESLREGGPVAERMREAAERARKDLEEAMDRHLKDAGGHFDELRARLEESSEQQRKRMEERRKALEERREAARSRRARSQEEKKETRPERPEAKERPAPREEEKADRGGPGRDDLDAAQREIRELREQLREATSRLERLQRAPRRPARPAAPTRPAPPATPAKPVPPPGARVPEDNDRRLRDLEEKMDRLLKELQDIKGRPSAGTRTIAV